MDELINIRKVSKSFGISTRTIRYYEEIGLLESKRPDGSKYRFYDKESIHKLEQILLLRSVKFSLEDISRILSCKNSTESLVMLQQRADELGKQIKSLSETKRIVDSIVKISNENGIESVNLYQLLKELIYLNKNNEGMIGLMKHEYKDIIKITVGKELIPICDPQQGEILLNAIKLMRKEIETKTNKKIPLIRVVDIETLSDYEYEIYIKDIKVFSGSLDAIDKNNYVKDIIGKLSQIIEKKMNEITEG